MPFTLTVDPAVRLSSKDAHHRPCSNPAASQHPELCHMCSSRGHQHLKINVTKQVLGETLYSKTRLIHRHL